MENELVRAKFESYPDTHRAQLYDLRTLILNVGGTLEQTGGLEETLKWGQPAYLPLKARVGTTVRLGVQDDQHSAVFFHCQSMLIERFRTSFGDELIYEKNRALLFDVSEALPERQINQCIRDALCYHLDKR